MDRALEVSVKHFVSQADPKEGKWAGVLQFTPVEATALKRRGKLFAVLDLVGNPNLKLEHIGKLSLESLKKTYFESRQASPLDSLAEAIHQTQEQLLEAAFGSRRSVASSVLSFNLAVASLWGAILYLTKVGSAAIYFSRGGVFREIGRHSDTNKIFSASGMVHEGDQLILGSGDFRHSFAAHELPRDDFSLEKLIRDLGNPPGLTALSLRFHFKNIPAPEELLRIKPFKSPRSLVKRILDRVRNFKLLRSLHRRKILKLLAIFLLIVLFLAASVFTINKRQKTYRAMELARLITLSEKKADEARNFIDLNNLKARKLLLEAREALTSAKEINPDYPEANQKIAEIKILLDQVDKVKRFNKFDLVYDLKIQDENLRPSSLAGRTGFLYVSDPDRGFLYRLELTDPPTVAKLFEEAVPGLGNLHFADSSLYFSSVEEGISVFDTATQTLSANAVTVDFPTQEITALATYFGNVYLLAPTKNQIFKAAVVADGYAVPTDWVKEEANLGSAVSMAIDGAIYVLTDEGEVQKFEKGQLITDFKLKGLDQPLSQPLKIFTTTESEKLYILDAGNKRIVVLRKSGFYDSQYVYEGEQAFNDPRDFWVDEDSSLIYLLDGTKIFKIPL